MTKKRKLDNLLTDDEFTAWVSTSNPTLSTRPIEIEAIPDERGLLNFAAPCPFCGVKHFHGIDYGHRVEHCKRHHGQQFITFRNGLWFTSAKGYTLIPPKPPVDVDDDSGFDREALTRAVMERLDAEDEARRKKKALQRREQRHLQRIRQTQQVQ
jgi:hypothetical protein